MRIFKSLVLFFLFTFSVIAQTSNPIKPDIRAIYIDNFSNILGSNHQEIKLFEWLEKHEINAIILYDLHKIARRFDMGNPKENQVLANFIKKAKEEYNIKRVSASGENPTFFNEVIHRYNVSRKSKSERFDVYNLEFEYWNTKPNNEGGYYCTTYLKKKNIKCSREGSFEYYLQTLKEMKRLAKELDDSIEIEAYIGNFNKKEIIELDKVVHRLLIHDYVRDVNRLFPYVKKRLDLIDEIDSKIKVSLIFSSEMNFLGKWFKSHTVRNAEKLFFKELIQEEEKLLNHFNFEGFTHYNYGYLSYIKD